MESAKASTGLKSPFVPRPPETTTFASVSSGRPPCTGGFEEVTVAFFAPSAIVSATVSTAGVVAVKSALTELGRSVMIGVPCETFE